MDDLHWTDARDLGIRGRAFTDTDRPYSRLPARARGVVPDPVWDLAQFAAGLYVECVTDAVDLHVELSLEPEMTLPAERSSGVDAYADEGAGFGWLGIHAKLDQTVTVGQVARGMRAGRKRLRLHLGHSARVAGLRIGVPAGAVLEPAPAEPRPPVLYYGTSIIHGYSGSRSGMTLPAQLMRRLGHPVLNLGFSGNARMEPALTELFAEVDAACYVVDCLPNMTPELVRDRCAPFVRILRARRPRTPILLVENIVYQATYRLADRRGGWGPKNDALKEQYQRLISDGVSGLHYLAGDRLLGEDGDGTVDGTHPSDLGYARMAEVVGPVLRGLIG